ncbi:MAG: putative Ig domain-containing protein [Hormoscilla sp.]
MATYNLTARPADSVIMLPTLGEADLLVVPEESSNSIFLAIAFETADQVDISAFPELSARDLIDNAMPLVGGVRLNAPFGQLTLAGITKGQLSEDNFINNQPPSLVPIENQSASENNPFSLDISSNITDVNGDSLTYSAALENGDPLPDWLNFDRDNGIFSGTPSDDDVGIITVDVTADDGKGGTVGDRFNIVVFNLNDPPTVTSEIPAQNGKEGTAFSLDVSSNFSDRDRDSLTYSATGLPEGLSINADTGSIDGVPTSNAVGTSNIIVTVDDGVSGTVSDSFDINIEPRNVPPTVTSAIAAQTAIEGGLFQFQFDSDSFSDGDGDILTYRATLTDGNPLPDWLSFNSDSRTFSGTPSNSDVGAIAILVTADDSNGGTAETSFVLEVENVNNLPSLDLNGSLFGIDFSATFTEGQGAVGIVDPVGLTLEDLDNSNLTGATVTITNQLDGTSEVLAADTSGTSINANYNNGILTLTGIDTVENYQQVLRRVTYNNTAVTPDPQHRRIQFLVSDGSNFSPVATSAVSLRVGADLQLTKTVNNPTPNIGDILTFTVNLSNNGPLDATNIQVTDVLPAGMANVMGAASIGTYNTDTGVWTVPSLASGQMVTLLVTGTVQVWGTVINRAKVTNVLQEDPDLTNNEVATTASLALPAQVQLTDIVAGRGGFVINGINGNDRAGTGASTAGDVNGDGLDDTIVGVPNANGSRGGGYVVFGKGDSTGVNLSSLGNEGFLVNGINVNDLAGSSTNTAGDVNGDGLDDIIVGVPGANSSRGQAYVVFGKNDSNPVSLSNLGTGGFVINGSTPLDMAGSSVSTAGDVNGDGLDDLIVGVPNADLNNNVDAGQAYVLFGKQNNGTINLNNLGTAGFAIDGINNYDRSGTSVSNAGDVNGDGLDDLIVGAPGASNSRGQSYIVFGKNDSNRVDLNSVTAGVGGFAINGILNNDRSGTSVSNAGDVNGDGLQDLIVGAPGASGGFGAGAAYVVFGKADGTAVNLNNLGSAGFTIAGVNNSDQFGFSVSSAGDVNADGLDDLILGAIGVNSFAGSAYVVYGKADNSTINVNSLGNGGFQIAGINNDQANPLSGDRAGSAVSNAGDLNGDGFADIMLSSPGANSETGASYVLFGGNFTNSVTQLGGTSPDLLVGTIAAEVFMGAQNDDTMVGGGGADVLNGGAGSDVIAIGSLDFRRAAGGSGNGDTLRLDGSFNLDLTAIANSRISGIEVIDLNGFGNSLTLSARDLQDLSDSTNSLTVLGNNGNAVNADFSDLGFTASSNSPVVGFTTYSNGIIQLVVDNDLTRNILV